MRVMAHLTFALLLAAVTTVVRSGDPPRKRLPGEEAPAKASELPAVDEKAAEALIDDLGSDDFAVRQAATEKLEQAGPDVIPILERNRTQGNPEVRARVAGLLRMFASIKRGAIIVAITPGSPAARAGVHLGDVLVGVNGTPVDGHRTMPPTDNERTLKVWRAGRLRTFAAKPGRFGIMGSDWDLDKGGRDQAAALAKLDGPEPDFREAYRLLRAAHDGGMEDQRCNGLLACLAARFLDRAYAAECYRACWVDPGPWCGRSHEPQTPPLAGLPFSGPHTEHLLGRFRAEAYTARFAHEWEDWLARFGRNGPLLKEALAKPWVGPANAASHQQFHELAKLMLATHERRYAHAVTSFFRPREDGPYSQTACIAMQAAVRGGDTAAALAISGQFLSPEVPQARLAPYPLFWGLAGAAVAGDADAVAAHQAALDALDDGHWSTLDDLPSIDALNLPPAGQAVRRWFAAREPKAHRPHRLDQIVLASLVADPAATEADFDKESARHDPMTSPPNTSITILTGRLRFGQYAKAAALADGLTRRWNDPKHDAVVNAKLTLKFVADHREQLAGRWKGLGGFVEVCPRPAERVTWVLGYDGRVYRAADDGDVEAMPDLPAPPPCPVSVGYGHLWPRPGGVVLVLPYGRDDVGRDGPSAGVGKIYVLDGQARRWVPAQEWDGPADWAYRKPVTRAVLYGRLDRSEPQKLSGDEPRQVRSVDSQFLWCEGNLLGHVHPTTHEPANLSAAAAKVANREKPVRFYLPEVHADARWLLFSDCGAWLFDAKAQTLARVPLGLPNEDVMTCSLPESEYGKQPGGQWLVGVAPQQGGQIFLVDPKTLKVTPTTGFCGLGPNDWYAAHRETAHLDDPQAALYARWVAKLKAGK